MFKDLSTNEKLAWGLASFLAVSLVALALIWTSNNKSNRADCLAVGGDWLMDASCILSE